MRRLLASVLVATCCVVAYGQSTPTIDELRKQLDATWSSLPSAMFFVADETLPGTGSTIQRSEYDWGYLRGRIYKKQLTQGGDWKVVVFDGKTEQAVYYHSEDEKPQRSIQATTAQKSRELTGTHNLYEGALVVRNRSIAEICNLSDAKIEPTSNEEVLRVVATDGHESYSIDLSRKFNWLAVHTEYTDSKSNMLMIVDVTDVAEKDGVVLPTSSRAQVFSLDGDKRELFFDTKLSGKLVALNTLDAKDFDARPLPTGATLTDVDSLKRYRIVGGRAVEERVPLRWTKIAAVVGLGALILSVAVIVAMRFSRASRKAT